MQETKKNFIQRALGCKVLQFGKFTLKSGRISPYFFNAGFFYENTDLQWIGRAYAALLIEQAIDFKHLFGPAYKGIPLATATAIALAEQGISTRISFNRKEIKDHGEGGELIGSPLSGKTVMIDDVISAGTAFRASQSFIQQHGGELTAAVITLNRCERGVNTQSAIADIEDQGIKVLSLITSYDLIDYLREQGDTAMATQVETYLAQYGTPA